ncbi:MAG: hypothetical protein O3B95_04165 [Chloroflexi bacterium]|nr:hypothetical protein [Chloroflexota bacterium]
MTSHWPRQLNSRTFFASLIVVIFVLAGCSGEEKLEPTPTAAVPTPTTTLVPSSTPVSTPNSTPVDAAVAVAELLASIEREIERLREIEMPPPVEHKFVDRAGMRARLAETLGDPEVIDEIEHEQALLKLLGVIEQDADLVVMYGEHLGGQVLGLYDPEKEQFFVLGDDRSGVDSIDGEAQLTYAHEYVHRLQDARFDLEAVEDRAVGNDMLIAISALIEGDATTVQTQYMSANFDFLELSALLESALAAQSELPESPYFLQRAVEFPYVEGAAFVSALVRSGGFGAVDSAFQKLPQSTEQILHPDKYFEMESPVELDILDDAMGSDWTVQAESVLGEFFLKTWLEALGSVSAGPAAAGWGGDTYAVFEDGSGGFALGVVIAWDTDADAREFIVELSSTMAANQAYSSRSSGLPGVLEAWQGPGGYIVLSRWDAGESGDRIGIAITSGGGSSHQLSGALATR